VTDNENQVVVRNLYHSWKWYGLEFDVPQISEDDAHKCAHR